MLSLSLFFSTDSAKVNYVVGLLGGKALTWAQALSFRTRLSPLSYDDLEENIKMVFEMPQIACC